ncbi:DUF5050 domain-containing protein [Serpentinicella alkaliphila]|uniref:Transglutaminase superfamily protein n=1 Tax=Serpentinicella alkaliphila TaxID=1734049 RepID=A0A4R2T680_9FIRM|nr:DUF5050 domain-containing protein [Serpentinicella alkaliphila]QUH26362.1 DUF5050 domain-containing protein [Serpentinicella alkaliphila]TCP97615.1 transglutaminase superfamily protein [Serpentinicella alkaliphila]
MRKLLLLTTLLLLFTFNFQSFIPLPSFTLLNRLETYTVENLDDLQAYITDQLSSHNTSFNVGYRSSANNLNEELNLIFDKISNENPYIYYFISNIQFGYKGYKNNVTIDFTVDYNSTKEEQYVYNSEINRILNTIITPNMSSLEKVKAVNDYIVLNTSYSLETINSPHSPYTIFKEGMGVCQAYALLGYKMLSELGFEVMYVVGKTTDDHAWNLVRIDNEWYHLDMTWNDPQPDRIGNISYNYFLVNDNYLSKTHSWERNNYPKSTSNKYSYFHSADTAITFNNVLYYSNAKDRDRLYRMNLDGSQNRKLNDFRSYFITQVGDWIYYSNYSHGGYLYRIKLNGQQNERVNNSHTIDLFAIDEWLYYTLADKQRKEKRLIN